MPLKAGERHSTVLPAGSMKEPVPSRFLLLTVKGLCNDIWKVGFMKGAE